MTNNPKISDIVIAIESKVFPIIFIYYSVMHMFALYGYSREYAQLTAESAIPAIEHTIFLSDLLIVIALIPFNFLIAYALLVSKNLHQKPDGFLEIFIPLIATFWFLIYNLIPSMASDLNFLVIPESLFPYSIVIGSVFMVLGLTAASVSIYYLRESFGILIQVRDTVTQGLYKYVRHPMYFGHIMGQIGLFLIMPRLFTLLLSSLLALLTLFRARLEEQKMAKFSHEYREYMRHTPFIIPYKIGK